MLREAVTMMELCKVADCEISRASYMYSVTLFIGKDDHLEAREWRQKAESIRSILKGDQYDPEGHGEWTYDMLVESWVR